MTYIRFLQGVSGDPLRDKRAREARASQLPVRRLSLIRKNGVDCYGKSGRAAGNQGLAHADEAAARAAVAYTLRRYPCTFEQQKQLVGHEFRLVETGRTA
jgi:hypothetical protein